jgi:hypothetical protein
MFALSSGLLNAQRSVIPARADARTVAHVLDRLGFGARPGDAARVQEIGLAAYIEQQLYPERIADGALVSRLSEFPTLTMSASQLSNEYFNPAPGAASGAAAGSGKGARAGQRRDDAGRHAAAPAATSGADARDADAAAAGAVPD